jgi:hypothetical protein
MASSHEQGAVANTIRCIAIYLRTFRRIVRDLAVVLSVLRVPIEDNAFDLIFDSGTKIRHGSCDEGCALTVRFIVSAVIPDSLIRKTTNLYPPAMI